jgi:hypothetical protein
MLLKDSQVFVKSRKKLYIICGGVSQCRYPYKRMRTRKFFRFTRKTTRFILPILFILTLFLSLYADKIQCEWDNVKKIIAVGDLHGDYGNFIKILKKAGIVDDELHWIAGKTHFVQNGDVMDRGDYAKSIFDLIKRLEKEAEEAGGKVHTLLGNHEELNITGMAPRYPRYVSRLQFFSFLPDDYRKKLEQEYTEEMEKAKNNDNSDSLIDASEKFWKEVITKPNPYQYEYTVNFNENYGKWLLEGNAIIRINDTIFVHGGISKRFSTWSLERINDTYREELNMLRLAHKRGTDPLYRPQIVYDPDAPLWFRDLATNHDESFINDVNLILDNLGVKHMVIAHTPFGSTGSPVIPENVKAISRFDDKIWIIDTGISKYYGGILSYLTIEDGKFSLWTERDEE